MNRKSSLSPFICPLLFLLFMSPFIQDGDFLQDDKDLVKLTSKLGTMTTATVFDMDVDTALNSSDIAVENNLVTVFSRAVVDKYGLVANHLFAIVSEREDEIKRANEIRGRINELTK